MNLMQEFDPTIKKRAALAGVFLLFMFVFLAIFFLVIIPEFQEKPLAPPVVQEPAGVQEPSGIFDGVPTRYEECMRTEERHNFQGRNRSKLQCSYTVAREGFPGLSFQEGDEIKHKECMEIGGYPISYGGDCSLTFYNPGYAFPNSFQECKEQGFETFGQEKQECTIGIDSSIAYDKMIAERLAKECELRGGDFVRDDYGTRCRMQFEFEGAVSMAEARECRELIAGHNQIGENRINLVLIGFDYTSLEKFINITESAIDFHSEGGGLFSLEPFKSNTHLFNIWFVATIASTQNQAKDTWDYSSLCRKKLGIEDHQFSPQEPLFSERMFTLLIFNKEMPASFVYVGENTTCSSGKHNGRCGLKGLQMGITRDNPTKSNIHDFVHEFAHIFTFPNINEEYRPDEYYEMLDEYARFPGAYSAGIDYMNIVKEHSNCFVGTYEACLSQENTLFGDLIGDGCGKDGIIDCCTRDASAIGQGARSCESCQGCQEDPNYDLEIACYESCWTETGIFRSTLRSIMSSRSGSQEFGKSNERLLCHQVQYLTGNAEGICKQ